MVNRYIVFIALSISSSGDNIYIICINISEVLGFLQKILILTKTNGNLLKRCQELLNLWKPGDPAPEIAKMKAALEKRSRILQKGPPNRAI